MRQMLYEGKAKQIFLTENEQQVVINYKDDATAFNGEKKGEIHAKGELNNNISCFLMKMLEKQGIPTHLLKQLNDREMLAKRLTIIPLEVVVRNITTGSLAKRLGWNEGKVLESPIVEFYYKDDDLGDPLINHYHIQALQAATPKEVTQLEKLGLKINKILREYFHSIGLLLVDFKLEFGKDSEGNIYLGDEISPDTCRFWDSVTYKKLDKDRFRQDLGGVEDAYIEVWQRIKGA